MNKAFRADLIPNKVLKIIIPDITDNLEQIFNDSISISYYPANFKKSTVVIFYK